MQAQEGVLDRIEQSFELFTKNFPTLFIPMFLYSLIATIFMGIATYISMLKLGTLLENNQLEGVDFYNILYTPEIIIYFIVGITLLLIYITLYIPFFLGLIKSTSQIYRGESPNWKKNLNYGFKNIGNSFKTYWFIFSYVALIPAILLIFGGLIILYGLEFENKKFVSIGSAVSIFSLIVFVLFSTYRGIRSKFSLLSAIDNNTYTRSNFTFSINITKNNFWRIVGNLFLIGFIGGIIISIFQGIINLFGVNIGTEISKMLSGIGKDDDPINTLRIITKDFINSYSITGNLINSFLHGAINTAFSVFITIFTYILYKRLEIENIKDTSKLENKVTEL